MRPPRPEVPKVAPLTDLSQGVPLASDMTSLNCRENLAQPTGRARSSPLSLGHVVREMRRDRVSKQGSCIRRGHSAPVKG